MQQPPQRIRVLIVDDIAETRENLRKLLSFDPGIEVVGTAATGEDGVKLAQEARPNVILMDINLPGIDGITATEQIVRLVPTAQIIILSVQGETGYMRRAMAAGARDFLVKPPSGDELMSTIRRVHEIGMAQAARVVQPVAAAAGGAQRAVAHRRGRLVTIFGPKGGVGCTSVAVNLAIALQAQFGSAQKVAVMDGNLQFGDVGVMLNLQPVRTIADLSERMDELDPELIVNVMSPHPSGIKVMLAPPRPEAAESLLVGAAADGGGNQKIRTFLRALLQQFDLVIADTWSWVDDVTLTLLDEATLILFVINPLIPSIKNARNFIDLSHQLGYPLEKLGMVINEADRRTGIRVEQIEKALVPALGHIPYDERLGIQAANRGAPLVLEEPGKPLAQAYHQLASNVLARIQELVGTDEADESGAMDDSRRMLNRIFSP